MAFTLNDTDLRLGRETLDSEIPKLSDVRNILFESTYTMPTFVRNESTTRRSSKSPALDEIVEEDSEEEEDEEDGIEKCVVKNLESDSEDYEDEDNLIHEVPIAESSSERIKVFLRVRPEVMSTNYEINEPEKVLWVKNLSRQNRRAATINNFKFDRIFANSSDQWPVVESCALPLLKDLLLGYNSLLFTYGITSSGKSFTMRGDRQNPGIIPTCLAIFFETLGSCVERTKPPTLKPHEFSNLIQLSKSEQFKEQEIRSKIINDGCLKTGEITKELDAFKVFSENLTTIVEESLTCPLRAAFLAEAEDAEQMSVGVWVSYWEVYNDKIYDLLNPGKHSRRQSTVSIKSVKTSNNSNIFILFGLKQVYVTSAEEAYRVFLFGQENLKKHISCTALNNNSSRSHSSFNITLVRRDVTTATISNLSFCDLAGRERTKKSRVSNVQLKETNNINQSLMYLGQCLSNLRAQKNATVTSYRNSKLTQVFQPYLSSDGGRTYIIYNLNPKPELFDDSYYSLDFCSMAKEVKQNQVQSKAVRKIANTSRQSIKDHLEQSFADDNDELMQSLRDEVNNITVLVKSSKEGDNLELIQRIEVLQQRVHDLERQKLDQEMEIKKNAFEQFDVMAKQYDEMIEKKEKQIQSVRDIYEERLQFTEKQRSKDICQMKEKQEKTALVIFEKEEEVQKLNSKIEAMSIDVEARDLTIAELKSSLDDQTRILREKDETILNLRNESQSMTIEIGEKHRLEQKMHHLKGQLADRDQKLANVETQLVETMKALANMAKTTSQDIMLRENMIKKLEADLKEIKEKMAEKESRVATLEATIVKLTTEKRKLCERVGRRDETIEGLQAKLDAVWDEKIASLEKELKVIKAEKEALEIKVKAQEVQLKERRNDLTEIQTQLSKKNSVITQLESKVKELNEASKISEESGIRLSYEAPTEVPSESSFGSQESQENIKPKKARTSRNRRGKAAKAKISADEAELLKSISKRGKKVNENDPPKDDMALCFSSKKDAMLSVKKKLHMSTTKRLDTSPIHSPLEATQNIEAASKPYNTRRNRKRLF